MSIFDRFFRKSTDPNKDLGGLPLNRISAPQDEAGLFDNLRGGMLDFVRPKHFPVEVYDILTNLTLMNADLRQAIGHVVQLGNTGHILKLEAPSDAQIEAMVKRIEDRSEIMLPYTTGTDGLVNGMFTQAARTGALSLEWVPSNKLDGIDKIFFVPVSQIRWVTRPDGMGYYPVQVPPNGILGKPGNAIVLNPRTFYYANLETMENSPYAVPPMIAALEPISVQKTMLKNIHKIMKKMGIMGLIAYKMAPPEKRGGETDERFKERCMEYLVKVSAQLKESFSEGIVTGFKGAFDFDVQSITGDAKGIKEIFQMNEEQLFSAIGADPAMHGRTYSTTETYASVVFSKMASQLGNYQRMVADGLEFGWGLDLTLAGLPGGIEVEFNSTQSLRNLQEAQTRMIEIANAEALYQGGVIDQGEKARKLGYNVPARSEPIPDPAAAGNPGDKNVQQRPNTGGGADNSKKNPKSSQPKENQVKFSYHKHFNKYYPMSDPIFLDTVPEAAKNIVTLAKDDHQESDPELDKRYRRYLQEPSASTGAS